MRINNYDGQPKYYIYWSKIAVWNFKIKKCIQKGNKRICISLNICTKHVGLKALMIW